MPSLSLPGVLTDTAGAASPAGRQAATAAARDASAAKDALSGATPAPEPFAQTLQQSVAAQKPGRHPAAKPAAAHAAQTDAAPHAGSNGRPSPQVGRHDTRDDAASPVAAPDAAALAAAAAVQAQLQAPPDAAQPAPSAGQAAEPVSAQASAQTTGQPSEPTQAITNAIQPDAQSAAATPDTAANRDVLNAVLANLRGDAHATPGASTTDAANTTPASLAAPTFAARTPTFDKTLADANGAFAQSQGAPQPSGAPLADAAVKPDATQALTDAHPQDTVDTTQATLAAANAAAQTNLQIPPAAGAAESANANALAPHVGTADWTDALSQKVVFLSNAHQQSAELTLNPPDLGPLQVVLHVADNHAHALFVSQHAQVREAVEAALPRLRDAMESGGLGLGSASVSDGGFGASQQHSQQASSNGAPARRTRTAPASGDILADTGSPTVRETTARRAGLVDTFA